jgi:hypothetical protein
MKEPCYELILNEPIQLFDGKYKLAITSLNVYNSVFNITTDNNNFKYSIDNGAVWKEIFLTPGAYEITEINNEVKRLMVANGHSSINPSTFHDYYVHITPNFNTQKSIIQINEEYTAIDFNTWNSIGKVLGFLPRVIMQPFNESDNKVNIISFDNIFIHCDIAQGMILNGKRSTIIHGFSFDVSPGFKYVEKFRGGLSYFDVRNSGNSINAIRFDFRNEHGKQISFNGDELTFHLRLEQK